MTVWSSAAYALLAVGTLVVPPKAVADSESGGVINGSLRGAYFSSSRNFEDIGDVRTLALWTKAQLPIGTGASMMVEAWSQDDISSTATRNQTMVREAYLDVQSGALDCRFGKQIIAWGRADKLNPTDNLTPRDYTLQMADAEDQRVGANAVMIRYHIQGTDLSVTGVWQPRVSPNVGPMRALPNTEILEVVPSRDQFALKLDHSGGKIDWSFSFLDGVNLNPDLEVGTISGNSVVILLRHNRVRTLGMDAAAVVGRYGLRGELAYTWTNAESSQSSGYVTKPFLYLVFGADREFDGGFNLNIQYFHYRVSNYSDPRATSDPLIQSLSVEGAIISSQLEPRRDGFSARIAQDWLDGNLEGEVALVMALSSSDYVLKPRLKYAINDQVKISVGADLFRGRSDTYFGRLKDTSTIFAELRYEF